MKTSLAIYVVKISLPRILKKWRLKRMNNYMGGLALWLTILMRKRDRRRG